VHSVVRIDDETDGDMCDASADRDPITGHGETHENGPPGYGDAPSPAPWRGVCAAAASACRREWTPVARRYCTNPSARSKIGCVRAVSW
jgi:hypothetical protein